MKKLLFISCLFLAVSAKAQISNPSLIQFVSDSVKNAEGVSAFNLHGDKLGGLYMSLRTLDYPLANAADFGAGAVFGAGHPDGLVAARINVPQLANSIFGTSFFQNKSHGPALPTCFIGPAFKASWPITQWTWGKDAFLLVGIPFGSIGL